MFTIDFYNLSENRLNTLDFSEFQAIFNLMVEYRHKLFDDEYFNSDKPYIQRVFEIIKAHIPYFWVFYRVETGEILGFSYFYDVIPSKNKIHSASATICFKKSARGIPALTGAKKLIIHAFGGLDIYKIKAECFSDNFYMPKFLTRLGFEHEASLKNETIVNNTPKNLEIWSLFNPKFTVHNSKTLS